MKITSLYFFLIVLTVNLSAQNITNTLGAGGSFVVKDGVITYLSLPQSTGYLSLNRSLTLLNTTSSTYGVIYKGANRFLHNFGTDNTFLGVNAGNFSMTGTNSSAVGVGALFSNTTGWGNTAIGFNALYSNTTGSSNIALGSYSLTDNTSGTANIAIGISAMGNNTTASNNIALGGSALYFNSTGDYNIAIGGNSLWRNTTGDYNVVVGEYANGNNLEGSRNTIIGYQAGKGSVGASLHSKSGCVFLGYQAGFSDTTDNKLYIDNTNTSSPLIWGDLSSNKLVINGNSTNNINNRTFFSNGSAGGTSAWFNDSDIRLKKNVATISNALDKVKKLKGVNFEWINVENRNEGLQMGFVAQEVNEVIPEVVDDTGEYYSMQYAPITALLVEAVKEQESRIKELEEQNCELKAALINNQRLGDEVSQLKLALSKIITEQKLITVSSK